MTGIANHHSAICRRVTVTAAASAVHLSAVYLLSVWTVRGQRFEDAVLAAGEAVSGRPEGVTAARAIDVASAVLAVVGVAGVLAGAVLRRRRALGIAALAVIAGSVATAEVLKSTAARPILLDAGPRRDDHSFPSGHTAVAASVMCVVVMIAPVRLRGAAAFLASAVTAGVGAATVTIGWHRPSDTLGSALITLFYLGVALAMLSRHGGASQGGTPAPKRHQPVFRVPVAARATGVAAGGAVVAFLATAPLAAGTGGVLTVGRVLACAAGAAVGFTLLALLDGVGLDRDAVPVDDPV